MFWIQKHGAKSDDYKVHLDGLSTLLNTNSPAECMANIPEVTDMWISAEVHYLQVELLNGIHHHTAKLTNAFLILIQESPVTHQRDLTQLSSVSLTRRRLLLIACH